MRTSVIGRYPSVVSAVAALWGAGYSRVPHASRGDVWTGFWPEDSRTFESGSDHIKPLAVTVREDGVGYVIEPARLWVPARSSEQPRPAA